MKQTAGNLIRALTEENLPEEAVLDVPTIVMENLYPSSIAGIVKDSYQKYQVEFDVFNVISEGVL